MVWEKLQRGRGKERQGCETITYPFSRAVRVNSHQACWVLLAACCVLRDRLTKMSSRHFCKTVSQHAKRNTLGVNSIIDSNSNHNISQHAARLVWIGPKSAFY